MTTGQYTELVAFLGTKFDEIKGRFASVQSRLDAHDEQFVEVRRHATVLFEKARDERRTMAEGLEARFNARFDGLERTVASLDTKVESLDATVASLDSRLTSVESNVASLDATVGSVASALTSLDASVRVTLADHEARLQALE